MNSCSLFRSMSLSDMYHVATSVEEETNVSQAVANQFLVKANVDTINSFMKNCNPAYKLSSPTIALDTNSRRKGTDALIQLRMYDNRGKLVSAWEQCWGNLKEFNKMGFMDSLPMKELNCPINYNLNLASDLNIFDISEQQKEVLMNECKSHNYTIVVFYATYTGWYSKDVLWRANKYIKKHKDSSILFLKLCVNPICN